MKNYSFLTLAGCIAACLTAGALGTLVTTEAIPTWYATLDKPSFNPPNWLFGPVWTLLYILMGIALYLVIRSSSSEKTPAYLWFGIQLALNTAWSFAFFGAEAPLAGLAVIIPLLISIGITMALFYRHSKPAATLLIPYLGWVSFATVLNVALYVLNR